MSAYDYDDEDDDHDGTSYGDDYEHDAVALPPIVMSSIQRIDINLDEPELIDGFLPKLGHSVLVGKDNSGKTAVAIDIAGHVAVGKPWRGMPVSQGLVLYLAAESPSSVERRVWAWGQYHSIDRMPLFIIKTPVNMLRGGADLILRANRELYRYQPPCETRLIVIDTLSRSMVGNENSSTDMGEFIAECHRISKETNAHVMVIHHTGKDAAKGARGHSSLRAAIDVELEVTPGLVAVTKSRDYATGGTFGFRLEAVPLGENSHGRVVTSVVAVNAEPAVTVKAPRLTKKQKCVVAALEAALAEHSQSPPEGSGAPADRTAVELARWEDAAVRLASGDDADWLKRDHFKGIAKALQAKGVVSQHGGLVWLT